MTGRCVAWIVLRRCWKNFGSDKSLFNNFLILFTNVVGIWLIVGRIRKKCVVAPMQIEEWALVEKVCYKTQNFLKFGKKSFFFGNIRVLGEELIVNVQFFAELWAWKDNFLAYARHKK